MTKLITGKYETLELTPGTDIKHAVWVLHRYNRHGVSAKTKFNGVWLYSDNVSLDSAYEQLTGMGYAEFQEVYGITIIEDLLDELVIKKEEK